MAKGTSNNNGERHKLNVLKKRKYFPMVLFITLNKVVLAF